MASPQEELRERTKQFAYRVIKVFRSLPRTTEAQIIGKQLLRSGTAVAANYRAANRARTHAEFVSKIGIVVEEADETVFWLECLSDNGIVRKERLKEAERSRAVAGNFCCFSIDCESNGSRRKVMRTRKVR